MPISCPTCRALIEEIVCPNCGGVVSIEAEESSSPLSLPDDLQLPFLAYGLFKPGELAFEQIRSDVETPVKSLRISGSLMVRDGLPLLRLGGGGQVDGYLLRFKTGCESQAYKAICAFEPPKQYRWEVVPLEEKSGSVNVLVGRSIEKGSQAYEESSWSGWKDPVFVNGLGVVRKLAEEFANDPFQSAPPDGFDWNRFFRIQSAYLLLWAIIERIAALTFGPDLDPMRKISRLSELSAFAKAVEQVVSVPRSVFDSRNPSTKYTLRPDNPKGAVLYYYAVRSNLSHRGKGAFRDGDIVRESLIELEKILSLTLSGLEDEASNHRALITESNSES